jgi:hypothetical protein
VVPETIFFELAFVERNEEGGVSLALLTTVGGMQLCVAVLECSEDGAAALLRELGSMLDELEK